MSLMNARNKHQKGIFPNRLREKGGLFFSIDYAAWVKKTLNRAIICMVLFITILAVKAINIDATNSILESLNYRLNKEFDHIDSYNKIKDMAIKISAVGENVLEAFNIQSRHQYQFVMPMEGIINIYFNEEISNTGTTSRGIVIKGEEGQNFKATEDGVVIETGSNKAFGTYIIIKHKGELLSVYKYCVDSHVNVNQRVSRGETIGTSSGKLLFEVWYRNEAVDPLLYLETSKNQL